MFTICPECITSRPTQTIEPREGYSRGITTMCSICDKQQKTCIDCGDTLPGSALHFHSNKRGLYGLRTTCRKCHNTTQRNNYYIRRARKSAQIT